MDVLVSILICNYNKGDYLRETLDSVIGQTYTNWECIIVDDHSIDNSWKILEEYAVLDSRFKIYKRPDNRRKGGNAARNYAFELSKGRYVNWLDSDDLINSIFLEEKLTTFQSFPDLDFVLSDIYRFYENLQNVVPVYDYENIDINPFDFGNDNYVFQTCMPLYKRSFLESFPYLFDEELLVAQDVEFHLRVVIRSTYFHLNKNAIFYWRGVVGSKTNLYQAEPYDIKYQKSYPAYKLIYQHILKNKSLSQNQFHFFKSVFNDMLIYIPINSWLFWDLLRFGTVHNLFKGRFQGAKILGIRILKSIKLI